MHCVFLQTVAHLGSRKETHSDGSHGPHKLHSASCQVQMFTQNLHPRQFQRSNLQMLQSILIDTSTGPAPSYPQMVPQTLDSRKTANSPKTGPIPHPHFLRFPGTYQCKVRMKQLKITMTLFLIHLCFFLVSPLWLLHSWSAGPL